MKRVVKIGGRAQGDARLPAALAAAAAAAATARATAGGFLCVVHGGGDEVTHLQKRLGLQSAFIGGRRVTSVEDLEIVRMVLSGATNKRIVAQLISQGVNAVGISGEDASVFTAQITDPAMGRVGGHVTANVALIQHLVHGGFVPVISPLARDADDRGGAGLNVNGDDAAAALAAALAADELVLVADVPGVLDAGAVIPTIDEAMAHRLISSGVAAGGMAAKLDAALTALRGGAQMVRIAGLDGISDSSAGTRIVLSSPQV
jgi:acetylglutamate kinase